MIKKTIIRTKVIITNNRNLKYKLTFLLIKIKKYVTVVLILLINCKKILD